MKKIYTTFVAMLALVQFSDAQWSSGTGIVYPTTLTDKVGIGTTSTVNKLSVVTESAYFSSIDIGDGSGNPSIKLYRPTGSGTFSPSYIQNDIYSNILFQTGASAAKGSETMTTRMVILASGNVGIGTASPQSRLHAEGSSTTEFIRIQSDATGTGGAFDMYSSGTGGFNAGTVGFNTAITTPIAFSIGGTEGMRVASNGNVGIGTTSPDQKLTVYGTIHSKEVKVDLSVPYPDYVFKPTYILPTLKEVKNFIDRNHHLPDMPIEQDVAKNGLNLGEMNALLTKKVEELTLYLIEQNKLLTDQGKLLLKQQRINKSMQQQITTLTKKHAN